VLDVVDLVEYDVGSHRPAPPSHGECRARCPNRVHERAYRPGSALFVRTSPARGIGVPSPQHAPHVAFPNGSYQQRGALMRRPSRQWRWAVASAADPPARAPAAAAAAGRPCLAGAGPRSLISAQLATSRALRGQCPGGQEASLTDAAPPLFGASGRRLAAAVA
jgi:hypothetical protein